MNISIEVPDDVVDHLQVRWDNIPRRTLEALALETFRSGVITEAQVQQMLKLPSRWEVEAFLKRAQVYLDYTEADLQRDIIAIRKVSPR
jgi:Uncharacterised protein family (UPF0175)